MRRALLLSVLVGAIGCTLPGANGTANGSGPKGGAAARPTVPMQNLERMTIVGYTTEELLAELERARAYLLVDKFDKAAEAFDKLMRIAKDPKIAAVAMFNCGVAYEGLGKRDIAVRRYRELIDTYADQPIARPGNVRLTRQLGYLERWEQLEEAADTLLKRKDLSVLDQIEGHGARALALVERGDVDRARIAIGKAHELIDTKGLSTVSVPPVQMAQVAFAEGEIRRLASEAIKINPAPPNFNDVLEARCQGLLDAQSAYTEAMRSRDAHWAAMAGFRVGQLYQQLHIEAMSLPPPKRVAKKDIPLFEAAMRLRYRKLVEKGLKMMEATVRLGDRTGEDSYWIGRARGAQKALEQALAEQQAALAKVPYTEDELLAGLAKLAADTQAKAANP